jgi:hypothetical protein
MPHDSRLLFALVTIGALLTGSAAFAADLSVALRAPRPVAKDIPAMPEIIAPTSAAERKINAALRRLDAAVQRAAKECKTDDGKAGDWERSVETPMHGPNYLSFVVTDSMYCGGAHPDASTMAIVYDLRTGAPVDWTRLLPREFTGKLALQEGADGTKTVPLSSKALTALYLAGYRPGDADKECRGAIADDVAADEPDISVWPDAQDGGLAMIFDLPHVVAACEDVVVAPAASLRSKGVDPQFVDAIEEGRRLWPHPAAASPKAP